MGGRNPFQLGIPRRLTGCLALGLLLAITFQPAAITTVLWFANHHGHHHQVAVQVDGNHFDVRLSHAHDQAAPDDNHESLGLVATLFSTHDHDGHDHVLHFNLDEVPDPIRRQNPVTSAPAPASPDVFPATASFFPPTTASLKNFSVLPATPPPRTAGLLGLRTIVLLV